MRLHHVQVSMPRGGEEVARAFYRDALGLTEVPKPAALAGRGGCWFRAWTDGEVSCELHLGVEEPFQPARRAHPAVVVGADELEPLGQRVAAAGFEVDWTERDGDLAEYQKQIDAARAALAQALKSMGR